MFRLKFKLIEKRPVGVVRDKWRDICREAFRLVGEHWFRNMFKQHFTAQAKHIYGHKPRSRKYLKQKASLAQRGRAALGGVVDNVLTGDTMRQVTSQAVIRGFPTRVKVSMFGPNYMRIRYKSGTNQPNKKREMVTTTIAEQTVLKRIMKTYITKRIKEIREKKTTVI